MTGPFPATVERAAQGETLSAKQAACCIAGAGPAGAVLALLLARRGISVILLEAHQDFEREFRGDTIHASVMEIMEELGLAERLLQLPHSKVQRTVYATSTGEYTVSDYSRLRCRYPYIMVLPQARFLEFITAEARRYPNLQMILGAQVRHLIEEDGAIRGIRYRDQNGWHEVRAILTVGADGRFSTVRRLAGLELVKEAPPMDVLWFRLPRLPNDSDRVNLAVHFGTGYYLSVVDRQDYWQVSFVIRKGGYQELRAAGIDALKQAIVKVLPQFQEHVQSLHDWSQAPLLSVELGQVRRWHRPGLLLLGDAAHVMSTVGGVGINCAIHDAVVAANVLGKTLQAGWLQPRDLAEVQRRRHWPIRFMQWLQASAQKSVIQKALDPSRPFRVPWRLRLPFMARLSAYLIAYGLWPPHVRE